MTGDAPDRRRPGRPPGAAKTARTRRRLVSGAQRRARVLQGRYMGSLRGLARGDQAKVKAARAKDGMDAALRLAASLRPKAAA